MISTIEEKFSIESAHLCILAIDMGIEKDEFIGWMAQTWDEFIGI